MPTFWALPQARQLEEGKCTPVLLNSLGLEPWGRLGPCLSEAWASPGAATCSLEALGPLLRPG